VVLFGSNHNKSIFGWFLDPLTQGLTEVGLKKKIYMKIWERGNTENKNVYSLNWIDYYGFNVKQHFYLISK